MSFADDIKPTLFDIRGIPGEFGISPHSVSLVESSYSGTHTGDGTRADTTTAILENNQNPKVRWLKDDEVAVAGLSGGEIDIGPITSDHAVVSRLADLRGDDLSDGDTRYLLITGPRHPSGAKYRIIGIMADKALHYMLRAQPVEALT